MSFNYEKLKQKAESNDKWASYSDLFMVLSIVFLLLYVVSSVRNGTAGFVKRMEYLEKSQEVENLKDQLKVYETLKEDYVKKQASEKEKATYDELMARIDLLQEEAENERKSLLAKAHENKQKKQALNKYQQLIKSFIDASMLKNQAISSKDNKIEQKSKVITAQSQEISEKNKTIEQNKRIIAQKESEIGKLNQTIEQKKASIEANNKIIAAKENELKKQLQNLKKAKLTAAQRQRKIAALKKETDKIVSNLESKNKQYSQQLAKASTSLNQVSSQLSQAEQILKQEQEEKERITRELASTTEELSSKKTELDQAKQTLSQAQAEYQSRMEQARADHEKKLAEEKEQFEKELKAQRLSATQKAQKLAEYNKKVKAKQQELEGQLSSLEKDLAKAKERINARKKLAAKIKKELDKNGVKADVDSGTGDVFISFDKDYFENDSAELKPGMEKVIKKFIPLYSSTLLKDPKIAEKISSVDIIGFASPTYQGRYVDPKSLDPKDKQAAQYNLDLSMKRARSIFNYIFDTEKITYDKQKDLLPLVKVTGRSFFTEDGIDRNIASGMSQKDFCAKYDCKKAQRVIIKFNLSE